MIYTVDVGRFITDSSQWSQSIYNYLSQYLDGLTYDSETYKINFWNIFELKITKSGSVTTMYINPIEGSEINLGGASDITTNVDWTFTLIKTDNFMYFTIQHPWNNGSSVRLFWQKEEGIDYVGGAMTGSISASIYDSAIYDMTSPSSPYYVKKLLDFTTASNNLAFSEIAIAAKAGNQSFEIGDLCSCSYIAKNSTVTIHGNNYLAIDTNNLIKLDPVAQEEE